MTFYTLCDKLLRMKEKFFAYVKSHKIRTTLYLAGILFLIFLYGMRQRNSGDVYSVQNTENNESIYTETNERYTPTPNSVTDTPVEIPDNQNDTDMRNSTVSDEYNDVKTIICQIDGQVMKPGVYTLHENARVFEIIELAGGLTKDAYTMDINQAEFLSDGEKIYVPTKAQSGTVSPITKSTKQQVSELTQETIRSTDDKENGLRVNINTADAKTLQTMSGIGPTTAEKIIEYRKKAGAFQKPEDIMNVSGIGEKTFEKIRDSICVK